MTQWSTQLQLYLMFWFRSTDLILNRLKKIPLFNCTLFVMLNQYFFVNYEDEWIFQICMGMFTTYDYVHDFCHYSFLLLVTEEVSTVSIHALICIEENVDHKLPCLLKKRQQQQSCCSFRKSSGHDFMMNKNGMVRYLVSQMMKQSNNQKRDTVDWKIEIKIGNYDLFVRIIYI